MRRRSTVLSALSAGALFAVTAGVAASPARADDPTASASPAASAAATTAVTTSPTAPVATTTSTAPTTAAAADPVDLSLSTSFGNDPAFARGSSRNLSFSVGGVSPGARLAVALPAELTFVSADKNGAAISCPPAGSGVSCDLGALDGVTTVSVLVRLAPTAPLGASLHVQGTVTPTPGPDANPGNNTAGIALTVLGGADVTQTQSTRQVNVPLSGSAPFTVTLHNNGPDAATGLRTRFTIQSNDNPRPTLSGFSSAAVAPENGGYVWSAGTLPAGATVSITVTISASSTVVDSEVSYSTSYDGVLEICTGSPACLFGAPIRTYLPGAGPELAATGSDDGSLAVVGVGLLVGGAVMAGVGRRRRLA